MGKFGINESIFSANSLNGEESAEKFKHGLNNFANPCTDRLLKRYYRYKAPMTGERRKMTVTKNSSPHPRFQYQRKAWNLSAIYLNGNKHKTLSGFLFATAKVAYITAMIILHFIQNFKFLMLNYPWQVIIAQNLWEYHFNDCVACFLQLESYVKTQYFIFPTLFQTRLKHDALLQRTYSCF